MAHSLTTFAGLAGPQVTTHVVQSDQIIPLVTLGQPTQVVNVPYVPGITYRFRGYYVAGGVFEVWTGSSKTTPPPSEHTLIDVVIEGTL